MLRFEHIGLTVMILALACGRIEDAPSYPADEPAEPSGRGGDERKVDEPPTPARPAESALFPVAGDAPILARSPVGTLIAVWRATSSIRYATSTSNGEGWSAPHDACVSATEIDATPLVVVGRAGSFYLACEPQAKLTRVHELSPPSYAPGGVVWSSDSMTRMQTGAASSGAVLFAGTSGLLRGFASTWTNDANGPVPSGMPATYALCATASGSRVWYGQRMRGPYGRSDDLRFSDDDGASWQRHPLSFPEESGNGIASCEGTSSDAWFFRQDSNAVGVTHVTPSSVVETSVANDDPSATAIASLATGLGGADTIVLAYVSTSQDHASVLERASSDGGASFSPSRRVADADPWSTVSLVVDGSRRYALHVEQKTVRFVSW